MSRPQGSANGPAHAIAKANEIRFNFLALWRLMR